MDPTREPQVARIYLGAHRPIIHPQHWLHVNLFHGDVQYYVLLRHTVYFQCYLLRALLLADDDETPR